MSRLRWIGSALTLFLLAGQCRSANAPPVIAKITLDRLLAGAVRNASPVFLSEDSFALLIQSEIQPQKSKIVVLRLAKDQIQELAETDRTYEGDHVFSVSTAASWSLEPATSSYTPRTYARNGS